MTPDPKHYIEKLTEIADKDVQLGEAAIMLAALQQPGISTERYINHLKKIAEDTAMRHAQLLEQEARDDVQAQLAALKHTISDKHAYIGDHQARDDIQNTNLIRVIDRAKGTAISLAIIYIDVARRLDWHIEGLNVPGHYMCRLEKNGERIIFDPFEECRVLGAPQLRQRLKETLGEHAELSEKYFEPQTSRAILVTLQNTVKFKNIAMEDYKSALEIVQTILQIDPEEYRALLEAGVLYAKLKQPKSAIAALESYIEKAPHSYDRKEAEILLHEIKLNLN